MKITPEIQDIKNAYMIARRDNNTSEMNRLKAKAMTLMNNNSSEQTKADNVVVKKYGDSTITENEHGDLLVLTSSQSKKVQKKLI